PRSPPRLPPPFPYTTLFRSARLAGRKRRAAGDLRPALGVDVEAGFFGIGRARQDHVGAMRAAVTMGADIDHERTVRHLHLVGPQDRKSTRLNSSHVAISYAV